MLSISEANFIVVDVETTGSNSIENRITDVACVLVKDFEVVDIYSSLVNPYQSIPWFIQRVTGINGQMAKNAPEPILVFKKVAELLQGQDTFFVAHNVSFDYSFVKESIRRLHIPFQELPLICSLKLAKKVLPSNIKKNVSAVAEHFNIPIINRHRAFDDALATANFFIEMLYIIRDRYGINDVYELLEFQDSSLRQATKVSQQLSSKLFPYKNVVSNQSGILVFIDKKGNVLHISKANNLKEQIENFIEQCLHSVKNVKNILKQFHRLEWIETNNELETIITEYRKIKQHKPQFNFLYQIDLTNANDIRINEATQKLLSKNFSMVVLLVNSEREKTIDIYFIKQGLYQTSYSVGRKANLNQISDSIHNIYFSGDADLEADIDEMKFINNWLNKNESVAKTIRVTNEINEIDLFNKIKFIVRSFYNSDI